MKLLCVSHPCVTATNQDFFARVQERSGWDVTLILPRAWKNEYGRQRAARWPRYEGGLAPLRVLGAGNIPLHVYAGGLGRVVARERPDVVYVHHEPYGLATAQAFRAARRLPEVRLGFYSAQNLPKRYPWPFSALERSVLARADFAFPVSEDVLGVLRTKGFRARAEVLPLPVEVDGYEVGEGRTNGFVVGYVGRLVPEKGVDVLLEALASPQLAGVRAEIVGDGPERDALVRRAGELGLSGRVVWHGYVPHAELPGTYGRFDVLAVPSLTVPGWTEQFGRVAIESLAAGVPVLTSDCGELPRLVASTGGGWIVPEGDAARLAERLVTLSARPDELAEAGVRGRSAVATAYGMDMVADRFVAVVQGVVQA